MSPPAGGGVLGGVSLATMQFHVTSGTTGLETVWPFFVPEADGVAYYDSWTGMTVITLDYDLNPGTIETIPEPGSALLLGLAMAGLAWVRRRHYQ